MRIQRWKIFGYEFCEKKLSVEVMALTASDCVGALLTLVFT